jgi:coenzyme PQQ precursor peptide PqqA
VDDRRARRKGSASTHENNRIEFKENSTARVLFSERTKTMEWTAPKFEEVALNCEINSYASAAL